MSETPKPSVVDSVLEKAKQKQQIDLTKAELQELARPETVEKAKVQLKTKEELKHFVTELQEERKELGLENTSDNPDQGLAMQLEDIERQIDAHATGIDAAVTIDTPTTPARENAPKTLADKVKNMFSKGAEGINKGIAAIGAATIGALVRGWIALQRMLISINGGDPQKIDAIERLYGRFFGAAELLEKGNAVLKPAGLEVVKDKKDKAAYIELQKEYNTQLLQRINADKANEAFTREEFTFDAFLDKRLNDYGAAQAGRKGRTTLTGILKNQRPLESSDAN